MICSEQDCCTRFSEVLRPNLRLVQFSPSSEPGVIIKVSVFRQKLIYSSKISFTKSLAKNFKISCDSGLKNLSYSTLSLQTVEDQALIPSPIPNLILSLFDLHSNSIVPVATKPLSYLRAFRPVIPFPILKPGIWSLEESRTFIQLDHPEETRLSYKP